MGKKPASDSKQVLITGLTLTAIENADLQFRPMHKKNFEASTDANTESSKLRPDAHQVLSLNGGQAPGHLHTDVPRRQQRVATGGRCGVCRKVRLLGSSHPSAHFSRRVFSG